MTFLKPVSAEKLLYIDLTKAKGAAFISVSMTICRVLYIVLL